LVSNLYKATSPGKSLGKEQLALLLSLHETHKNKRFSGLLIFYFIFIFSNDLAVNM